MQKLVFLLFLFSVALYGASPDGYKIETITTPADVYFHVTGLDIARDGSVYCATRFGDVWVLKNDKWQRFADGLQEPCGLVIDKDGSVIVTQKLR